MTIQRMEHVGIVVELDGVRADVAMVETPDGHGRLELIVELAEQIG